MMPYFFIDGPFKEHRLCWIDPVAGPESLIDRAKAILGGVPILGAFVDKESPDEKTIRRLTDQTELAEAFCDASVLTAAQGPLPVGVYGPKDVLLSKTKDEREEAIVEFAKRYIPSDVLIEHVGETSFERIKALGKISLIQDALRGILGAGKDMPDPGTMAETIARASLNAHYNLDQPTKQHALQRDVQRTIERQSKNGIHPTATTSTTLIDNTPPSELRGALRLGLLDDHPLLKELSDVTTAYRAEHDRISTGTTAAIDVHEGVTRDYAAREAMGMRDVWQNLGGGEKLVLLITAFMLLKSDQGKPLLFAGVAAYFGYKFLNKGKDPLGAIDEGLKRLSHGHDDDPRRTLVDTVDAIYKVLEDKPIAVEEAEVQGATALRNISLHTLATHFTKKSDNTWSLNLDELRREGDANVTKAVQWLDISDENKRATNEMLAYIFHRIASKDPRNLSTYQRVREAMGDLESGHDYTHLPADVRGDFDKLIDIGKNDVHHEPDQTLGTYCMDAAGLEPTLKEDVAPLFESDPDVLAQKGVLEASGYRFFVLDPAPIPGDFVRVMRPGKLPCVVEQTILKNGIKSTMIGGDFNAWLENAVESTVRSVDMDTLVFQPMLRTFGGPPVLMVPAGPNPYDVTRSEVRMKIVSTGKIISIPREEWVDAILARRIDPVTVVIRAGIEFTPAFYDAVADRFKIFAPLLLPDPDTTLLKGPDSLLSDDLGLRAARLGKLRAMFSEARFKAGLLRAVYDKVIAPKGISLVTQCGALSGADKVFGDIVDYRVRLDESSDHRWIKPTYTFTLPVDGTNYLITYEDTEGFIDKSEL